MEDFRGNPINEGDIVAYFQGGRYDSLNVATVLELRAKVKITISESSRGRTGETTWASADRLIVLESADTPYPCGHKAMEPGCGGCDPGAIEFVILEDGTRRAFDPALDLLQPDSQ